MARTAFIVIQIVALAVMIAMAAADSDPSCATALAQLTVVFVLVASSALLFVFVKSPWMRAVGVLLVLVEAFALIAVPGNLRSQRLRTIELADPAQTVADAREILSTTSGDEKLIQPEDLPESLRIHRLYVAQAHGDHIDLVVNDDIDGHAGFRIWNESDGPRGDHPTKYPDIYFYVWNNDHPEGPGNRP